MLIHFQELMEDADMYGWRAVVDYHAGWLQHLEQGRAACGDKDKKTQLRWALVWNCPVINPKANINASTTLQVTQAAAGQPRTAYVSQQVKPGDNACHAYNAGKCMDNSTHPLELYVCQFCLTAAHCLCKHMELVCKGKGQVLKKLGGGGLRQVAPLELELNGSNQNGSEQS